MPRETTLRHDGAHAQQGNRGQRRAPRHITRLVASLMDRDRGSQTRIAELLGVDRSTVAHWTVDEGGRTYSVPADALAVVCDALDTLAPLTRRATSAASTKRTCAQRAGTSTRIRVARPRKTEYLRWGTLPGAYTAGHPEGGGGRGKPLDLMRALVHDYSRPGDLVCDPTAGYATTGVAALGMGRRFVGAECDEAVHAEGLARLSRVQPVDLFDPGRARQPDLGGLR